jgi:hypothetical protein
LVRFGEVIKINIVMCNKYCLIVPDKRARYIYRGRSIVRREDESWANVGEGVQSRLGDT